MSRITDDFGLQQPSIPIGGPNGVEGLLETLKKSTLEMKNLLKNECDLLYECRCCKNIFRSPINYLTHKRSYCRTLHAAIAPAFSTVALDFATSAFSEDQKGEQSDTTSQQQQQYKAESTNSSGTKTELQQPKRAKGILKRTNLFTVLNKRMQHYALTLPDSEHKLELHTLPKISRPVPTTTFKNGQQVIETFPHALVTKEPIPSDRVPVVIPQDNSSRYREMNLRNRRGDSSKNGVARTVGPVEIGILERMGKYQTSLVELSSLTCSHSDCKEKLPFSSLFTLAYHLTVKHNRRSTSNKQIPCYLCNFESQTYTALTEHLKMEHEQYYLEHASARSATEELKRGRKGKQTKVASPRGRSLSPLSDDFIETEESADGSDEYGSDMAPVLEPMTNIESVKVELKQKGRINGKKESKNGSGGAMDRKDNADSGEFVSFKKVSEIEWGVKNCMDYMIAAVSGDVDKAQALEDIRYDCKARAVLDVSCKTFMKSKGRPRNVARRHVQQMKVAGTGIKRKKHGAPVWLRTARKNMANASKVADAGSCKDEVAVRQSDEDGKKDSVMEPPAKKRGRGRKPKPKVEPLPKTDLDKGELSGNSDEVEDVRKQRPSRQRRKPNWIDENFVTGFRSKRPRRNEMDDDEPEFDYLSAKGPSPSNGIRPSSIVGAKCAKSAGSSQSSSPVDPVDTKVRVKSEASSEETSNSSTPGRQQSPCTAPTSSIVASSNDSAARIALSMSDVGSSVVPSSDAAKEAANKKTCRLQYTPRARRMKYGDEQSSNADEDEIPSTSSASASRPTGSGMNAVVADGRSASQSRRKQDLSTIRENNDELMIVRYSNGEASLPKDLSEIPVYLTETQRDLFFSFIRPASPSSDGAASAHKCMQCGDIIANISEGRRHAVSHLRIMRLRCSLCDCGSFFCSDMRTHLQYRHCDKLYLAPKGYVAAGDVVPCMTQRQADDLTKVVDPMKPGRVMYTSGKIISSTNPKPYFPDPVIEARVLGALLPENSNAQLESRPTATQAAGVDADRFPDL